MNLSLFRVLFLSLSLLGSQTPILSHGQRSSAAEQEAARKKAAAQTAARKQAPRAQSRPTAPVSRTRQAPGGARTPNRNQGNAPISKRPAPKAPADVAKRPAPKTKAPANVANRPALKAKAPANVAKRPAPKAKAPANVAKRLAPNAPAPGDVAKRPAPKAKAPANVANRPAPKAKAPANVANRTAPEGNVAARPAPKLPVSVANRSRAGSARPPAGGRTAFVPGKVVDPSRVNPAARAQSARIANHPASHVNRARPRALNQVAASNINSNNQATSVSSRTALYTNNNWGNQWTNNRTSIWNSNRIVNNRPVHIHPNFQRSYNYAYRPVSWGSRPWWSSPTYHTWHRGSWNYGWNRSWLAYHYHRPRHHNHVGYFPGYRYYDPGYRSSLAWGLAAWTLGSLAYDTGYYCYRNPYHAPAVRTRTTIINYTRPLSVIASTEVPEPEEVALTSQERSTAAMERARAEFGNGDYLAALQSTDEAISFAASDSALHEFRALCLFALGRYGDAAGVLNPVLASGPGWDWATMAAFYPDENVYTVQLRKLEAYVEGNVGSADAHFVLGYHYMVAGHIDEAYAMFDQVVALQPADLVAVQLRNLAESSSADVGEEGDGTVSSTPEPTPPASPEVVSEPIEPTDIEGGWKAVSAEGKSITLTLDSAGTFIWEYEGAADGKVLSGDWSIDEESRLVLASTDVQMVADISLDGDTLLFVLAGSPVGDPGLTFQKR